MNTTIKRFLCRCLSSLHKNPFKNAPTHWTRHKSDAINRTKKTTTNKPKSNQIKHNHNHRNVGKLYASSAFFTPGLHPTVEDQVELARRISSSLSDANNKLSKGQTMYSTRKKRSVKWVHEGEGICFSIAMHNNPKYFQFEFLCTHSERQYDLATK